ncbi:MAG TPA: fumarylacetoacetase [Candidatus Baltobacteraceae bacterium]|nr:fumarylacetoacetase [Candidatus Baltobacteraceae bacterium]
MIAADLSSWVPVEPGSDFPIQNLPYGVFEQQDGEPHIGVAIGEQIFDLHLAAEEELFENVADRAVLQAPTLNALLAAGPGVWSGVRSRLADLLVSDSAELSAESRDGFLVAQSAVRMLLPFAPGDYVDFYSSLEHATNLGKILRPNTEPLLPNWRWIPIGYHGRSSTIVVDGTPVVRPNGQRKGENEPTFGPTRLLDVELEMGFVTGSGNRMGTAIPVQHAGDHIFGLVLVNDWSARDIQAWEYQPLGPFLGKSFATSVSPWVVPLDALEPYRVRGPEQTPEPLEYLRTSRDWNYDVTLTVELQTPRMRERGLPAEIVSRSNFKYMYWNMAQQLAHATCNGTAVRAGDLYASGTISGPDPQSAGSLIELTWRGERPLHLQSGESRTFLEDGDTVTMRGFCEAPGKPRIGFGCVRGTIVPS